jgi:hypothetical protein
VSAAALQPEVAESSVKTLARRPSQVTLLRPIAPVAEVIIAQEEIRELIQKALKPGRDYGTIPGTKKPTLYKAGAERTANACGLEPRFRIVESEIDHDREVKYTKRDKVWRNKHKDDKAFTWKESAGISYGLYRYVTECQLVSRETGDVVGSFMGVCSTMESKYVDRPRDCDNTALKMSEKRSLVGAVLVTLGLSDQFTQDVEDLPREIVQNGQSANAPGDVEEEVVDAEIVKDLAWAKAFPLPFRKHKHFNDPIDTRSTDELQKALDWTVTKINEEGVAGNEPSVMLTDFAAALRLILAERKEIAERDQTKLDLGGATAADIISEPTTSATEKHQALDSLEGKEDPTSKRALHSRIQQALKSPAISVETRQLYADDNVNGFKGKGRHTLSWWASQLESIAGRAGGGGPADPTDVPEALQSPDNDGLPF